MGDENGIHACIHANHAERALRGVVVLSSRAIQVPCCGGALCAGGRRSGTRECLRPDGARGRIGAVQRQVLGPPLRRALLERQAIRVPGLRMQWENREPERLPFQKQWENFNNYNMGRWRSRALHLNPETGEYMEPFVTEMTVNVMPMEEGVQSAKQLVSIGDGNSTVVPKMSESVVTFNDELECTDDGSYSLDRSLFDLPDVAGTFRFCMEFSLALSSQERVRCLALYDFESKLSRIVLYEERRMSSTGAQRLIGIKIDEAPEPAARTPLTLLSCLGEFRGDAAGRRAARLGGGNLRFGSRSDMQWSQDKLRREMQVCGWRQTHAGRAEDDSLLTALLA